jgi:DNA-binding response OmpR family regulator
MQSSKIKKILIVEDERPMAYVLGLKLENSGFEIRNAFSGEEAIAFLKKEPFDLVLLDVMLPGKDGFGVLSEMKRKGIKTPVIILSNLGQKEDFEKAKKMGAIEYIVKSNVSISEIIKRIQKI